LGIDAIRNLSIPAMAETNAHCYLWTPNALISEALEVMRCWGFEFKTMLVWVKHQMGLGNYYRNSSEPILFGVKGRLPVQRHDVRTWFLADRQEHSRKPNAFYQMVELMSPGPRIDVFSREKRAGWDQYGDQCDFFNSDKTEVPNDGCTTTTDVNRSGRTAAGGRIDCLRMDERPADPIPESGPASSI
jgi:N6-adenosine-specific RNA methylase IME4